MNNNNDLEDESTGLNTALAMSRMARAHKNSISLNKKQTRMMVAALTSSNSPKSKVKKDQRMKRIF
jgi:hypothetical protein